MHTAHEPKKNRITFNPMRDDNHLLWAGLLLVLATLVTINAAYIVTELKNDSESSSQSDAQPVTRPHVLRSTQTAHTPSLVASINKIAEIDKSDPAFTLEDNETLLSMMLTITNRTSSSQFFIPTSVLYVHTGKGDYRPLHPSIYVTDQIFSGTLKPGQTVSGQISFSVPKQEINPLLYIDTGWNDEVPIVFSPLK